MNDHFERINKFAYSDDCDCYDSIDAITNLIWMKQLNKT